MDSRHKQFCMWNILAVSGKISSITKERCGSSLEFYLSSIALGQCQQVIETSQAFLSRRTKDEREDRVLRLSHACELPVRPTAVTQCQAIKRAGTGHVLWVRILPLACGIGRVSMAYWGAASAGAEFKLRSDLSPSNVFQHGIHRRQ